MPVVAVSEFPDDDASTYHEVYGAVGTISQDGQRTVF